METRRRQSGLGVPQNLLLRPDHEKPVRPHPAGLFVERQFEELRLGREEEEGRGLPDRRRVVLLVPPHPGPGHLRSPWGSMVRHLGQGHRDGHPLMSYPRAEPSLSPPHRGSRSVFVAAAQRPHEVHSQKKVTQNQGNA